MKGAARSKHRSKISKVHGVSFGRDFAFAQNSLSFASVSNASISHASVLLCVVHFQKELQWLSQCGAPR